MRIAAALDHRHELVRELDAVRRRTLALVAHLRRDDLERVIDPLLSPLVWDLGHIAAYEDLWAVHRSDPAQPEILHPELARLYDAFETPRSQRGQTAEQLGYGDARYYLDAVRERTLGVILAGEGELDIFEMVLRHELQHTETMRQAMARGGLLPEGEPTLAQERVVPGAADWVTISGGLTVVGADDNVFAYDNERGRHAVDVPAFTIARRPVTTASFLSFSEGGGYERREWWSDEGWAWKEEYDISHHHTLDQAHPATPACHVSWFEADAFARASGARLPTEAEWEKASTSDQLDGVRAVWEWTASEFAAYPHFSAHPYREYSEVFFDRGYRVLRGGSWATHPRVATRTFRNWDLPERRQLFAGLRLVRDEQS